MRVRVDLHNHSCLSPCASLEQSPSLLARLGTKAGLQVMALTDHNSALNCPAFLEAATGLGLAPLFGLEACSAEEVHVVCLFPSVPEALDFSAWLKGHLLALPYDAEKLGDEVVVDAREEVLELLDYYLGGASDLGFEALCLAASQAGGAVIPAHVDRPMFSVGSQLGFLPPGPYAAVEAMRDPARALFRGLPVISGSDAHYPEHVGRRATELELDPAALAAGRRGEGRVLFEALLEAFRTGRPEPYWEWSGK